MASVIGPEANLLEPTPASCRQILLPFPVLDNDDLAKLVGINDDGNLPGFARPPPSPACTRSPAAAPALAAAIDRVAGRGWTRPSPAAPGSSCSSDRDSDADRAPIPSLLLTSAVHQHLVRQKSRTKVALVVESGDAREVHHVALLLGYGAGAVNPYLALETVEDMAEAGLFGDLTPAKAVQNTVYALGKGVLKVMSKMGISTVGSYRAAQVFACFGIDQAVLDEYFTGTVTRTGGTELATIAADVAARHALAFNPNADARWSTADWRSAASTSGAARARSTCSTRRPSTCCSTPPGRKQESVFRRYTDAVDELSRHGRHPARAVRAAYRGPCRRCRSTRSSRPPRSSGGSSPGRCPTGRSRSRRTRRWPSR